MILFLELLRMLESLLIHVIGLIILFEFDIELNRTELLGNRKAPRVQWKQNEEKLTVVGRVVAIHQPLMTFHHSFPQVFPLVDSTYPNL